MITPSRKIKHSRPATIIPIWLRMNREVVTSFSSSVLTWSSAANSERWEQAHAIERMIPAESFCRACKVQPSYDHEREVSFQVTHVMNPVDS